MSNYITNKLPGLVLLICILSSPIAAAQGNEVVQTLELSAESEVVLRMGEVVLTHGELDAYVQRLPKEDRPQAVANMERIDQLLQSLILQKALYEEGKSQGLLENSELAFKALYAVSEVMAEEQLERAAQEGGLNSYEQRAHEMYLADPDRFRPEPSYDFTHVLVSISERTEAEAMQRILEVLEKARSGQALSDLVAEYSDERSSLERGGAYYERSLKSLDRNFAQALEDLDSPGDLTGPVRSRYGWHVIRLDGINQPKTPDWDEVRAEAIDLARKNHMSRIRKAYVNDLLDSDAIQVVPGSIEKFQKRHGYDPNKVPAAMNN